MKQKIIFLAGALLVLTVGVAFGDIGPGILPPGVPDANQPLIDALNNLTAALGGTVGTPGGTVITNADFLYGQCGIVCAGMLWYAIISSTT